MSCLPIITVSYVCVFNPIICLEETLTLTEERPEEPVRNIFGLLALITLFYFFLIGGEHPYIAHIFAISVCSKLHFSVSDASINNSVFWGGYGLGRLVAVPLANYVKPGKVIMMFLTGTVLTLAIMAIFGEWVPTIWWVTTFLYGFCSSPLYPAMVSWISQLANISGKYIFIVNLGNSIGSMSMVPVGAVIFQNKPFDLVYFSLGMAITMSIVFAVMIVYGKRYKKKIAYSKNEIELSQLNSE
ncbi:sodium-dependent glucose transporter 1A-like [Clavelina lepadiformis]|uniref:sodium-dependent glucose transporter 1A-like n=1 Tax=Clavelina lepadiformis TaxID=159417 RepID=UPI0040413983